MSETIHFLNPESFPSTTLTAQQLQQIQEVARERLRQKPRLDVLAEKLLQFRSNPSAQIALQKLEERGSLRYLSNEGLACLEGDMARWLYWAESNQGSELLFRSRSGTIKSVSVNAFLNEPERHGVPAHSPGYLSVELESGYSVIAEVAACERSAVLQQFNEVRQFHPLASDRPLHEILLDKLVGDGHLQYLSATGRAGLNLKLLKYLDYAVNIRPGSEAVYIHSDGGVRGLGLEELLAQPEKLAQVIAPLYLAIEVGQRSVLIDTQNCTPTAIANCVQQAQALAQTP
jgi:hypothetical protein